MKKLILLFSLMPVLLRGQITLDTYEMVFVEGYDTVQFQKTIIDSDTYYNILNGTPCTCEGFAYKDSALTLLRTSGYYLFLGSSSVELDAGSASITTDVTYALFINNETSYKLETPFTFSKKENVNTISIATIVKLNHGDIINVKVKSNIAGTVINVKSF